MRPAAVAIWGLVVLSACCHAALERVWLLHRHGARTPMGVVDGATNCDLPYCALSDQGKAQLTSLGHTVRDRYAAVLNLTEYDVTRMHSVSTAIPRVVLSAEAMLTGMYPDGLPFVDFVPSSEDIQMSWWTSWPSFAMAGGAKRRAPEMSDRTLGLVNLTWLAEQAAALGMPTNICQTEDLAYECASVVSDTYFCRLMQSAPMPAVTNGQHATMLSLRAMLLSQINGYFPLADGDFDHQTGAYGYALASAMINALIRPSDGGFQYDFIHRAAHDWTLLGFYAATGVWSPAKQYNHDFAIAFAESVFVERHSNADGVDTLRTFRARPAQVYSASYSFPVTIDEIGLKCVDAAGNVTWTNATGSNGCPIDDVWRAINLTAPQSSEAYCYTTPALLQQNDCTSRDAPVSGSTCETFRSTCVSQPCGGVAGQITDAGDSYSCKALNAPPKANLDLATFGVTGGVCAAVGLVAGSIVMALSRKRLSEASQL